MALCAGPGGAAHGEEGALRSPLPRSRTSRCAWWPWLSGLQDTCCFHAGKRCSLAPGDALGKTQNYLPKPFGQIGSSPDGHQSSFSPTHTNRAGQQTGWNTGHASHVQRGSTQGTAHIALCVQVCHPQLHEWPQTPRPGKEGISEWPCPTHPVLPSGEEEELYSHPPPLYQHEET